jgi:hypothetical protein
LNDGLFGWEESIGRMKQLKWIALQLKLQQEKQLLQSDQAAQKRKFIYKLLHFMEIFRSKINEQLLALDMEEQEDFCMPLKYRKNIESVIQSYESRFDLADEMNIEKVPSLEDLQQERRLFLSSEIATWNKIQFKSPSHHALGLILERLHTLEEDFLFQKELYRSQKSLCALSKYTLENFAYGTTPFGTWMTLIEQCPVLEDTLKKDTTRYTVFGSSTGLLVFYIAALYPHVNCQGYEILPFLTKVAQDTAKEFQIESNCHFYCQNMLDACLKDTNILVLTSQCWDQNLQHQVRKKLIQELPSKVLVIDYGPMLLEDNEKPCCFEKCTIITAPVSWNSRQRMYILQKK